MSVQDSVPELRVEESIVLVAGFAPDELDSHEANPRRHLLEHFLAEEVLGPVVDLVPQAGIRLLSLSPEGNRWLGPALRPRPHQGSLVLPLTPEGGSGLALRPRQHHHLQVLGEHHRMNRMSSQRWRPKAPGFETWLEATSARPHVLSAQTNVNFVLTY